MRKRLLIISGFLLVLSCERLGSGLIISRPRYDTLYNDASADGGTSQDEEEDKSALYILGVEFPESYDWRRDSAAGNSQSTLVLYRDTSRILSIPSGTGYLVSTDPETHHLVGGNVYTECTTATQTVIKCNSEELFRYNGRELLKGLMVRSGDVWTLGQNKSSEGFSLRRNGEAVMIRQKGTVIGDDRVNPLGVLYEDGDVICFAFKVQESRGESVYIVEDGNATRLETGMSKVCDVHRSDGVTYVLGTDENEGLPVIRSSKGTVILNGISGITEGMFVDCGTYLAAAGRAISESTGLECNFTKMGGKVSIYEPADNFYVFYTRFGLSVVSVKGNDVSVTMHDGQDYGHGENCWFYSRHNILFSGRDFIVSFSPRARGYHPFVETSDGFVEYPFNGFISCIELVSSAPT